MQNGTPAKFHSSTSTESKRQCRNSRVQESTQIWANAESWHSITSKHPAYLMPQYVKGNRGQQVRRRGRTSKYLSPLNNQRDHIYIKEFQSIHDERMSQSNQRIDCSTDRKAHIANQDLDQEHNRNNERNDGTHKIWQERTKQSVQWWKEKETRIRAHNVEGITQPKKRKSAGNWWQTRACAPPKGCLQRAPEGVWGPSQKQRHCNKEQRYRIK